MATWRIFALDVYLSVWPELGHSSIKACLVFFNGVRVVITQFKRKKHVSKVPKEAKGILPGQRLVLQVSTSLFTPRCEQFFPPFSCFGFVHSRSLDLTPPAQDALHADHNDHSLYPPLVTSAGDHQGEN